MSKAQRMPWQRCTEAQWTTRILCRLRVSPPLHVFFGLRELLVIFHVKPLQMLNPLGGVVRRDINSTPPDSGLTHAASRYLPCRCVESKTFRRQGRTDVANCCCWAAVVSVRSCRLSRVTVRHIRIPVQHGAAISAWYLINLMPILDQTGHISDSYLLQRGNSQDDGCRKRISVVSCTLFCELHRKRKKKERKKQYLEVGRQADDGQMSEFVPLCWGQLWEWGCSLYIKRCKHPFKNKTKQEVTYIPKKPESVHVLRPKYSQTALTPLKTLKCAPISVEQL